jgi:uncharacterized protein with PQ loop repeat|tara:strand:+ start:200 stop:562 length:363 start_codon:yes stop_codon:yes gene_type:complete
MNILFVICGYISTILTTISYLPQIVTVIMHKSGKNISYPYISLIFIDILFYLTYGIGFIVNNNLDAIPIVVGSCLQLISLGLLFTLKVYYNTSKKISNRKKNRQDAPHDSGNDATEEITK